jgi:hypothetical protein
MHFGLLENYGVVGVCCSLTVRVGLPYSDAMWLVVGSMVGSTARA